jgi:hypothetical protein
MSSKDIKIRKEANEYLQKNIYNLQSKRIIESYTFFLNI